MSILRPDVFTCVMQASFEAQLRRRVMINRAFGVLTKVEESERPDSPIVHLLEDKEFEILPPLLGVNATDFTRKSLDIRVTIREE